MADRNELFYGGPGTGKSEAIVEIIRQVALETGLTARALVGDGSASTYIDSGLVDAGIVEVVNYTARDYPQSTFQLLTEGYWPADVHDPTSPLIKPDPKGKPDEVAAFKALMKTGVTAIEGLSVGSLYIMGDNKGGLAEQAGRGIKIGQDSPIRIGDGEYKTIAGKTQFVPAFEGAREFGANPPSHYNVAQRRMLTYVDRSKMLPGKWVIWTAHERAAEGKLTKEIIVGPEAAGEALTSNLPRIFGNTLHFTTASKRVKAGKDDHTGKDVDELDSEYRIYTRDHYSPDGNVTYKFRAITRGMAAGSGEVVNGEVDGMPLYLTGGPGEAIREFYMRLKTARLKRMAETKAAFEAVRSAA